MTELIVLILGYGAITETVPRVDCHMLSMSALEVLATPGAHMSRPEGPVLSISCEGVNIRLPLASSGDCETEPSS